MAEEEVAKCQDLPDTVLSFTMSFLHGFHAAGRPAAACKGFASACHGDVLCQYLLDRDFAKEELIDLPQQPFRPNQWHREARVVPALTLEALLEQGQAAGASTQLRSLVNALRKKTPVLIGRTAALEGRPALLQWAALSSHGALITAATATGEQTALMVAATGNHPRTTAVAARYCRLEQHHGRFGTALHLAAYVGAAAAVAELVLARAELTARNESYLQTPLHVACSRDHLQVVDILLNAGSDPSLTDKDGWTALRIAQGMGSQQVLERLQEQGTLIAEANRRMLERLQEQGRQGQI